MAFSSRISRSSFSLMRSAHKVIIRRAATVKALLAPENNQRYSYLMSKSNLLTAERSRNANKQKGTFLKEEY